MQLTHRFTVAASIEEAWATFSRLDQLAPCFPGARVTEIDGTEYAGSVKIKFGPVPLVYTGTARVAEQDRSIHRLTVRASANDRRGNGTATATVSAQLSRRGDGTEVDVRTDLTITGRPAQLGQGVIQDVSDRLLEQFSTCLAARFAAGVADASAEKESPVAPQQTAEEPASDRDTDFATSTGRRPSYVPPAASSSTPHVQVLPSMLKQSWPYLAGALAVLVVLAAVLGRRTGRRGG